MKARLFNRGLSIVHTVGILEDESIEYAYSGQEIIKEWLKTWFIGHKSLTDFSTNAWRIKA